MAAGGGAGASGDSALPFLLAPGGLRLLQVQPSLRCNLRCRHCYSESGPRRTEALPLGALTGFLEQARGLGYGYVGVSGGEPLLWPDLDPFLEAAVALGYSTSVITNGTLLTQERAATLRRHAGVVAVSVDGPPDEHDAIRGAGAFAAMLRGVHALRDAGQPFTLLFTLTRENTDRLSWLHAFADEVGATTVEIHPLLAVGAAASMRAAVPGSVDFAVAGLLLALLAERRGPGGPRVVLDVVARDRVERSPLPLLSRDPAALADAPFCDLVPSLVVEPSGRIAPFIWGFPSAMSLGFAGRDPLRAAAAGWRDRHAPAVARMLRSTLGRLQQSGAGLIDLFGELLATATTLAP